MFLRAYCCSFGICQIPNNVWGQSITSFHENTWRQKEFSKQKEPLVLTTWDRLYVSKNTQNIFLSENTSVTSDIEDSKSIKRIFLRVRDMKLVKPKTVKFRLIPYAKSHQRLFWYFALKTAMPLAHTQSLSYLCATSFYRPLKVSSCGSWCYLLSLAASVAHTLLQSLT